VPVSDEQGIGKLRAEMPQHLADTGLRGGQELRRPRDAAFVQQRVQDPQLAQVQFGFAFSAISSIPVWTWQH
jgi:hypothetical protein